MTAPVSMQGPMTYAQEMARKVFDATEEARGLAADIGWPKVEAVVVEVIERCAQEAGAKCEHKSCSNSNHGESGVIAARIRALAASPAPHPAAVPTAIGPGKRSSFPADYGNEILAAPQLSVPAEPREPSGLSVAKLHESMRGYTPAICRHPSRASDGTCHTCGAPARHLPAAPGPGVAAPSRWDQAVIDCSARKRGITCSVHGAPAPGVPPAKEKP